MIKKLSLLISSFVLLVDKIKSYTQKIICYQQVFKDINNVLTVY